jgi:hypothetical protein
MTSLDRYSSELENCIKRYRYIQIHSFCSRLKHKLHQDNLSLLYWWWVIFFSLLSDVYIVFIPVGHQ